jgi:predicted enzyme related to lactoylglutathione lyase
MRLYRITIAANDVAAMHRFYTEALGATLGPPDSMGIQRGTLAGLAFTLCPNTLTHIVAEKNRQQMGLQVEDLDAVLEQVRAHGGRITEPGILVQDDQRLVGIVDPDGNTLELIEVRAER